MAKTPGKQLGYPLEQREPSPQNDTAGEVIETGIRQPKAKVSLIQFQKPSTLEVLETDNSRIDELANPRHKFSWTRIYKKAVREYKHSKQTGNRKNGLKNNVKRLALINRYVRNPGRLIGGAVRTRRKAYQNSDMVSREDFLQTAYEALFNPSDAHQTGYKFYQLDYMDQEENFEWVGEADLSTVVFQLITNSLVIEAYRHGYFIDRHRLQAGVEKQIKEYLRDGAPYVKPSSGTVKQIATDLGIKENKVRENIVKPVRKDKTTIMNIGETNNERIEPKNEGWNRDSGAKTYEEKLERIRPKGKISPEFSPTKDELKRKIKGLTSGEKIELGEEDNKLIKKPLSHAQTNSNMDSYRKRWRNFIKLLLKELKEGKDITERKLKIAKSYIGGSNQRKISKVWHISQATVSRRITEVNKLLEKKIRDLMNK